MRHVIGTVLALTLALGAAGSARAAKTVDQEKFKGSQAATSFTSQTAITCSDGSAGTVSASGFISGSDSISKETGTAKSETNGIFIELEDYSDSCDGTSVGFGEGGISNGYTAPNKKLNSAGLNGVASVQDIDTGNSVTLVLDLVIEGTGPVTATTSSSKTRTVEGKHGPVTIQVDTSADSSRAGDVSGTITINGVELDATYSSTTLAGNASTEITITKN